MIRQNIELVDEQHAMGRWITRSEAYSMLAIISLKPSPGDMISLLVYGSKHDIKGSHKHEFVFSLNTHKQAHTLNTVRLIYISDMSQITLIGEQLASVGMEFVYQGESSSCEGCPYRDQCLNLSDGVQYEVTAVREDAQLLECAVHENGVRAVEVEPTSVLANVDSQGAYAGSKVKLSGPCPHTECPSHPYCEPAGADFDTEYQIKSIEGEPPHDFCKLDRELTLVEFEPSSE
ncbi:MAG: uncharacterized protein conserved in archaea [Haloquadratum sp. J07HQX50]|nr:MAG: uncharacterized protein conserved in archaea [Haloquadratum sp. J07HQX50]